MSKQPLAFIATLFRLMIAEESPTTIPIDFSENDYYCPA
jgi:hypothetical protein